MINNQEIVLKQLFKPCSKTDNYLLPSTTISYHSIQEICDFKKLSYQTIHEIMIEIKSYINNNGVLPTNQYVYDLILKNNIAKLASLPKTFEIINPSDILVNFDKIYGNDDLKNELMDIVNLFKFETNILNLGNKLLDKVEYSKGFILHGEAGVGKTLFAKAIAKQCELPFVAISGSTFQQKHVGEGKDLIHKLFKTLRHAAPVILFIDEIDAIGQRSCSPTAASHSDEIINQLLAEIDGINTNQHNPIMIIGATNYINKLDSALIRPCRFDKILKVEKPNFLNLKQIIIHIAKEYNSDGTLDLSEQDYDYLTRTIYATDKGTGAFVANLFKLAYMKCKIKMLNDKNNPIKINKQMLDILIDELILGNEIKLNQSMKPASSNNQISTESNNSEKHIEIRRNMQRRTAYHEAGHAAIAYLLSNSNHDKKVHKVTVVPRNNALGMTYISADYDVYEKSQESMLNQICILFAGACSESMFLDSGKNTGASSDIECATNIANSMVREYGLAVYDSDLVDVMMNYNSISNQLSDMIKNKLDIEVMTILRKEKERCQKIITDENNKKFIQLIAEKLMEKEVIFEEEINEIANSLSIKPINH